jgi:hypothetical protein
MSDVRDLLKSVSSKAREALEHLDDLKNKEMGETWDSKYVSALPNAAFAVVESGYKDGMNKGMRHLPHHSKSVKSATENTSVDLPHYQLR